MTKTASALVVALLLVINSNILAQEVDPPDSAPLAIIVSQAKCCPQSAWPQAEQLIFDELTALGLMVKIVSDHRKIDETTYDGLREFAISNHGVCAVRIMSSNENNSAYAQYWLAPNKLSMMHAQGSIELPLIDGQDAAAIAALRLVETLWALMIQQNIIVEEPRENEEPVGEKPVGEEPVGEEPVGEEPVVKEPDKDNPYYNFYVGAAFSAQGSPGGLGAQGAVGLSFGWFSIYNIGLMADGTLSVLGKRLRNEAGEASFGIGMVRGWLLWRITNKRKIRPSVGIGSGIVFPWTKGISSGSFDNQTTFTIGAYVGATSRVALVLSERFDIALGARIGFLPSKIVIKMGEGDFGSFGQPLMEGALNARVYF